jgi:transposase
VRTAFVDYSGKRVLIVDQLTVEVRLAELFIALLGASNLAYAAPGERRAC